MDKNLYGRVMVNGDSNSFFYNPEMWQPEGGRYSKRAIHNMVKSLADAGFDTFLLNPNVQLPCYPSKRLRYIYQGYTRGDREYERANLQYCECYTGQMLEDALDRQAFINDKYLDLVEEGTDWLAENAVACRAHGISPWVSIRMNDSHGGRQPQKSHMNNDLLINRPDLWLDKPCIDPESEFKRYSMDYSQSECREYMLTIIEDVLTYDYEGMELDFCRDPVIAKPIASEQVRNDIFAWIQEIRRRTNEKGKQIGKPFHLGIRASFNTGLLYDYGLDVDRCVEEGLFDFVAFSNTYQTCWDAPIDEMKQKYGDKVAVYGYIDGAVNWFKLRAGEESGRAPDKRLSNGRNMDMSGEMILGNGAGKRVLGADGLIFYNCFIGFDRLSSKPAAHWAVKGLFDIENLRNRPKAYSLATAFFYPLGTVALERPAAFPEYLWPSASRTYRLPMLREDGEGLVLRIQVAVEKKEGVKPRLAVSLNNHWPVADHTETNKLLFPTGDFDLLREEHVGLNYEVPIKLIKEGWNELTIFNLVSESEDRQENERNNIRIMNMDIAIQQR